MLSLYFDAKSPVHRLSAGFKLTAILVAGIAQFLMSSPMPLLIALTAVAGLYSIARIPPRVAVRYAAPVLPFLAVLIAVQVFLTGMEQAAVVCLRILFVVLLANLVTLTTRTSEIISVIEAVIGRIPRYGPHIAPQIGILVAMTLRFIPLIKKEADDISDAQRARGVETRMIPLLLPLLIKTLRMADQVSEALEARGVVPGSPRGGAR